MQVQLIVGVVAFACALACAVTASMTVWAMVDEVNKTLPEEEQFSPNWWYWSKRQRLNREYKKLYPNGKLLRKCRILTMIMFACGLICVLSLGFYNK